MNENGRTLMPARELGALLAEHGIRHVSSTYADTADEAASLAADRGVFPVVLKAAGLNHKSDAAGVVLGLSDAQDVRRAGETMLARLGDAAVPLVVQPQLMGFEVLVGLRRSAGLGASLVVGMGGKYAELFDDTQRRLVPTAAGQVRQALQRLRCWPILTGARGGSEYDVDALVELAAAVSELAVARPDIVELDLNPVLVAPNGQGAVAVDARIVLAPHRSPTLTRPLDHARLDRMLAPKSIAVVGVSDSPGSIGAAIFGHLLDHGYDGDLVAVHPAGGDYRGKPRAPSLSDLPMAPDLVSLAVPAAMVPDLIAEAAAIGSGAVIVHGSGFAESGGEGAELQQRTLDAARHTSLALCGPNSMGIVAPKIGLAASLSSTLQLESIPAGRIALVSSSGALGSCLASRLAAAGVGLSYWISPGNEADLEIADFLHWLAGDSETTSVGLILDHVGDGARMLSALHALACAGKTVFVYHMARTERGQRAALSHTGAMVGSYEIRRDVLETGGAVAVRSLNELENVLALAHAGPLPQGRRLGIVTASGGACVIMADEAYDCGLVLPALGANAEDRLRAVLPSFASASNPLDVTASIINNPDVLTDSLRILARSGDFDTLLVQFTTNADPAASATARGVIDVMGDSPIPIYVSRYGSGSLAPEAVKIYEGAGIPVLDGPDDLVRAVAGLIQAGLGAIDSGSQPERQRSLEVGTGLGMPGLGRPMR